MNDALSYTAPRARSTSVQSRLRVINNLITDAVHMGGFLTDVPLVDDEDIDGRVIAVLEEAGYKCKVANSRLSISW